MLRTELIQKTINNGHYHKYLEIGTNKGWSFLRINCPTKWAVDPNFIIPFMEKIKWSLSNNNQAAKYFEMTSDDFFASQNEFLEQEAPLDIAFVDGLHTYRAALLDTLNSLKYLQSNGTIVLHDCNPPNELAATVADNYEHSQEIHKNHPDWDGCWCGDVWKAIVYLKRAYPNELESYVFDSDWGLGIVRFKEKSFKNWEIDEALFETVNQLSYDDLHKDRESMIGLRSPELLTKLLADVSKGVIYAESA